jgi:O-antigen ligase
MTRPRLVWSLFAAAFLVSTIASQDPLLSLAGRYSAGAENAVLLILCYLAWEFGTTRPPGLSRWITVAGIAGVAYLGMQRYHMDPWIWSNNQDTAVRAMGAMGQPVFSGLLVALALPWVASWWVVAGVASAIWLTGSRAALLAAGVAIGWRLWEKPARRPFLLALAAFGIFAVVQIHRPLSDAQHVAIARVALRAWRVHPWLGWGPATGAIWFIRNNDAAATSAAMLGQMTKHSHNLITNVLATQGLLGLAAWVLLLGSAWRAATSRTRAALLGMAVFGMFEPIPAPAYVVLALAVGMDEPPVPALRRRGLVRALSAAFLFAFLSWEMVADNSAHLGDWGRAADMCPWEYAYCERVSDKAVASAWRHKGNPMAYAGAIESLRQQDRPKSAEVLVRIENGMDPLSLGK